MKFFSSQPFIIQWKAIPEIPDPALKLNNTEVVVAKNVFSRFGPCLWTAVGSNLT